MNIAVLYDKYRKVLWFAGFGAVGCLVAALAGELWLAATRTAPEPAPVAICLVLDCSGSMAGGKLTEMQHAASDLVERQTLAHDRLAVVGFDTTAKLASPLLDQKPQVVAAINSLGDSGSTNMAEGLRMAFSALSESKNERYILLFTDGMPDSQTDAEAAAEACRASGIHIVAVATGDADTSFLAQLTRDATMVFAASVGQFGQAFERASKAIHSRQLVESDPSGTSLVVGVLRIAVWTLLLAIGIGLGLIAGQNLYLHRPGLSKSEAIRGSLGSAAAGLVAGAVGQLAFAASAQAPAVVVGLGRIAGWTLVGLLLGLGIARFVPNLKPLRGLAGGALGGAVGAVGFLLVGLLIGDVAGRLVGAGMVGLCIGAMIAIIEAVLREAWLEIEYGPSEIRTVSLGREPITLGSSSSEATVYIPGVAPIALCCTLEDGKARCEELPSGHRFILNAGDNRKLGKTTIRVRAATSGSSALSSVATASGRRHDVASEPPAPAGQMQSGALPAPNGMLYLRIRIQRIAMPLGTTLRARQIPGVESASPEDIVAEVVSHPSEPSILGLKNLSEFVWETQAKNGTCNRVEAGRTARLAAGTRIRFGGTEGVVEEVI